MVKLHFWEIVIISIVWFSLYLASIPYKEYEQEMEKNEQFISEIKDYEKKIKNHPMSKTLTEYWKRVNTLNSLDKYKDLQPDQNRILSDLSNNVFSQKTWLKSLSYSVETQSYTFGLGTPQPQKTLEILNSIKSYSGFQMPTFSDISEEEVLFPGDRVGYPFYTAWSLNVKISPDFLKEQFKQKQKEKQERFSNPVNVEMEETSSTWSLNN